MLSPNVPSIITSLDLPMDLHDGLASLVRGPVFRRSDSEFTERSKTFNGKIKSLSKIVVSPLDAQDVSAIVRFCTKNGLSLSVKAGGYGIAGWAVGGDVIVDMSMIREVDIEAPTPIEEGEGAGDTTWTKLKDMPPIGSKGKGRTGVVKNNLDGATEVLATVPTESVPATGAQTGSKRHREDSPTTQPSDNFLSDSAPKLDDAALRSYDSASHAVASFLRGPALPPVPGDTPREPALNRRRLHSPEPEGGALSVPQLQMPVLEERQLSGGSNVSSGDGSVSGSRSSFSRSTGTATTTPPETPIEVDKEDEKASTDPAADPFGYMSSAPAPRLFMYSGAEPSAPSSMGSLSSSLASFSGTWRPFASSSVGPSGISASPFGFPNPLIASQPPPTIGPLPLSTSQIVGGPPPAQPIHTHAYVTIGAGMRQKEVDTYTAENPLEGISRVSGQRENGVVPYHVPLSAHPVGSSTMILGGFGFLSRMYGMSIDNLLEVEMVLADGRIVIVNQEEDPELWWAVRGAGPAFGIATRYKIKAFPVPIVFAGNIIYRFHRATAPSLIKHFRDCIKGAPRELYANVLLTAGPADKDSIIVIQMCYVGPKEKGIEYLQAISSWDGERCLLNEVNEKSYLNQQDSVAQVLRGQSGRQWFMRSSLIHSLPDEVINQTVLKFANTPIGCTWIFELAGGAIGDFEDTCLPKGQREAVWTVAALHQWDMGIDDPRCITSAEDWMGSTIKSVSMGGPFPTFLGRHETVDRTKACYGKYWDRLAELKKKYDPEGLFRYNFWPLDKDGQPIQQLYNEPPSP